MQNLYEVLLGVLKKDPRLGDEGGGLLKNKAQELARKNDAELIAVLFENAEIKKTFFFEVGKATIFDRDKFIDFVSSKQFLPDSYTAFKNKIGLEIDGEYLAQNRATVLVWPYKDCVLEGGMTKEDQRRDEIFYNETLAPDDITRLLDEKVLTNFKRIDKKGEYKLEGFKRDDLGTIKDNLIIKGNNLLALSSIKPVFGGKVKLIYIDPPYNTGSDSFGYNDSFNHSTWLVFMKNRLEAAKDLLAKDGSIWINIDDGESHYLKVLCDEIFGRENFVANVIWEKKYAPQNDAKWFADNHDHILVFAKKKTNFKLNLLSRTSEMDARYKNLDNDPRGAWTSDNLLRKDIQKTGLYEIITPAGKKCQPPIGTSWRVPRYKYDELFKDNRIWFGKDGNGVPRLKRFLNEVQEGLVPTTIWGYEGVGHNQEAKREINALGFGAIFDTPKPERLLQRILEIGSKSGDLVLDFFAGSGTTLAAAHKMGRQYIGIEQMDYIHDLPEARIKKVIAGEQGGISEAVGWKGGGDFVYLELAAWNQKWVERIREAKTKEEMLDLWKRITDEGQPDYYAKNHKISVFLSWKINFHTIDQHAQAFADLSIPDQKKFLLDCLNMNHLYINYSEIEDKDYAISAVDTKLNNDFYA